MTYNYYATCTKSNIDFIDQDIVLADNSFKCLYKVIANSFRSAARYAAFDAPNGEPWGERTARFKIEDEYGNHLFSFTLFLETDGRALVRIFRQPMAAVAGMKVVYWDEFKAWWAD